METYEVKKKNYKGPVLGVLGGVIVLVLALSCVASIPTGHTGVVTTFGKVENYVFDSGIHFKEPWKQVICMDNRVQKQSVDLSCLPAEYQRRNSLSPPIASAPCCPCR